MMTKEERLVMYERLETQNGRNHQMLVAIEEMSEVIKEITKILRTDTYSSTKNICEEIADAKVGLEQLERFFDPESKAVPFMMDYKLNRLDMFYLKDDKQLEIKFDSEGLRE